MSTNTFSLAINLAYAVANAIAGILTESTWLVTLSAYYTILSVMRFSVVLSSPKNGCSKKADTIFVKRFSGAMLIILGAVLLFTAYLTVTNGIGKKYHEIIMITIATYTFTKATVAVVLLVKARHIPSRLLKIRRNISCADAAASVFSLQRSMLVSFGDMSMADINIFNTLTGIGVSFVVVILGINLIRK